MPLLPTGASRAVVFFLSARNEEGNGAMSDRGTVALWVVLALVWSVFVAGVTVLLVAPPPAPVITFTVAPEGYVCPEEDDPGWDWRFCGNRTR